MRTLRMIVAASVSVLLTFAIAWAQDKPTTAPAAKPAAATKPVAAPPVRRPAPPAAAAPEPMPVFSVLDSASTWRGLYSWNAPLVNSPEELVELRGKDIFNWMTVYPPEGWTAVDFDDSAWCRDRFSSRLRNGELDERAGGGSPSPNIRQISVRGKFTVNDPSAVKDLRLTLGIRGGAIVYLNGKELARQDMPAGEVKPGSASEPYPDNVFLKEDGKPVNWFGDRDIIKDIYVARVRRIEKLPVPAELLRKGTNVLAVEIHAAPYPEAFRKAGLQWATAGLVELRLQAPKLDGLVANVVRPQGIQVWNANLIEQIGETSWADPHDTLRPVRLAAARNGAATGKIVISSDQPLKGLTVKAADLAGPGGKKLPADVLRISSSRMAGQEEGMVPSFPAEIAVLKRDPRWAEPLRSRNAEGLPAIVDGAVACAYVTARIPKDAAPGQYKGTLTVTTQGLDKPCEVPVVLDVAGWTTPDPADFVYWYGLIQSPEGVALHYELPLWSDEHLKRIGKSFEMIRDLGAKVLFVLPEAETEYGNERGMVVWSRGQDGKLSDPDCSAVEKYVDVAMKHLGKPRFVVLAVWQYCDERTPPRVTVRDAQGELTNIEAPKYGTPEALEMWRPALHKIRDILARHGLADRILLGSGSDNFPSKATVGMFHEILPEAGWESHLHDTRGAPFMTYEGGQVPTKYISNVWGQWDNNDPATKRVYGWAFPPQTPGGLRTWLDRGTYDNASFTRFRTVPEQILLANRPGLGQIGADFWPYKRPDGKGTSPTYGRFPRSTQAGPGNKACTTNRLLYPGPDGAVPTVRYELTRENLQECEARIYLEKLLTEKPCRLSDELAKKCQTVLDERTRWHRLAYSHGNPQMVAFWPYSGWQQRTLDLFLCAGEAFAAVGMPQPPAAAPAKPVAATPAAPPAKPAAAPPAKPAATQPAVMK